MYERKAFTATQTERRKEELTSWDGVTDLKKECARCEEIYCDGADGSPGQRPSGSLENCDRKGSSEAARTTKGV